MWNGDVCASVVLELAFEHFQQTQDLSNISKIQSSTERCVTLLRLRFEQKLLTSLRDSSQP